MKRLSIILLPYFFFLISAFCPLPSAFAQLPAAKPIKVKVAVVIQDPVLPQYGGKRLHEVVKTPGRTFMWNDPMVLNQEYEAALEKISHGVVQYEVVTIIDDGRFFSRRNDNNAMLSTDEMVKLLMEPDWKTLKETGTHFDYKDFVEYYGFDKMRDKNQINEVWVWSFPYGGMAESNYCGATGFWLNSEPTTTTTNKDLLVVMGLNYERKMSLALESYGHRFESVMWHVYGRWDYSEPIPNNWEKYTRFNKTHPGLANIGNIHFPPNGMHDYDWVNKTPVTTCADGWSYYPDIKPDITRTVDCSEWQCSHEGYMSWWFSHIPHFEGINPDDGHLNNWWQYVVNWEQGIALEKQGERKKAKGERKIQEIQNQALVIPAKGGIPTPYGKVLWYHEPDSTVDMNKKAAEWAGKLRKHVENGGSLLLTMDAVRLLPYLGVEKVAPTVSYTKLVDDGNGRKLGLHAFRSHPIFDGMLGGAYVYAPKEDVNVRRVGWFGEAVPDGKVVAADWAYIFLHDQNKLITEYTLGKGKILAIGAYLDYDMPNFNRKHLEKFTQNVLDYLSGNAMVSQVRYWDYGPPVVAEDNSLITATKFGGISNPGLQAGGSTVGQGLQAGGSNVGQSLQAGGSTVGQALQAGGADAAPLTGKPVSWVQSNGDITLRAIAAPKNMWDIAGERMVILGKEAGGIDEVWAHPVMALRDYQVKIRMHDPDKEIVLNTLKPAIEVRPESFTRIYAFGENHLKEIITVHPTDGNAVIHYAYSGNQPVDLVISLKSNLRFMWPYSEKVTGEIRYSWDEGLNAWVVRDKSGDFAMTIGMNVPVTAKTGTPDQGLRVALTMETVMEPESMADVVLGTSATGVTEAVSAYRRAAMKPDAVYAAAVDYAKSLFNGKLTITGPDANFNTGYKWALVGSDRFIVNTPGVGRSLVAGYATTDYGWNGAQKVNGRPGYAWYFGRDAVWSGFAVLDYGDFERVKTILELFSRYQDVSGKIYHELTTSGIAHFDAADATPLYIVLAGKYLHHSGDTAFIRKEWPYLKKAIDFCYSTDTDGDHLIENTQQGHGWEEGGDLYVTHTTQYMVSCWAEALSQAAYMAENIGLKDLETKYSLEAKVVLDKLNTGFWNPETNFFNHGIFKDGTYMTEPSVMTAIPLHWGQIRSQEQKRAVVDRIASPNFTTDWGTRIVSEQANFFAPGGYHTGSVWPLFTGWASLGDFAAGNSAQGYSKLMSNLLIYKNWSLGYIEEVLHGTQYKYFGVCRHQCWSETMVIQPAIDGMLGFKPDAIRNYVYLNPQFPMNWDSVTVGNIRIGVHSFSMTQVRRTGQTQLDFVRNKTGDPAADTTRIYIAMDIELLPGTRIEGGTIDTGRHIGNFPDDFSQLRQSITLSAPLYDKIRVIINHYGGIGVLPEVPDPAPGDSSTGLKIISDELAGAKYQVKVEGLSGSEGSIRVIRDRIIEQREFRFPELKEKYVTQVIEFEPETKKPSPEVVYYVLPRSFYDSNGDRTGDLNGLKKKLDYLQELGVTSILTLPLMESESYHNYFAKDYWKIDPEYGTMKEFTALLREIHKRGMKFYLDMETQYVTEGSDWYANKPDYQLVGTPWGKVISYDGTSRGLNMANLNHPEVKRYFYDLYRYFLDPNKDGKFDDGVDGFRIDHIMDDLDFMGRLTNLYADFWKPLFDELRAVNPNIRIIGEQADWMSYGREIFEKADLDLVFAFPLGIAVSFLDKNQIQNKLDSTYLLTPPGKDQLIFIENHDVDRFASRMNGELAKEKVGAAFNLLLKGTPLIYYGQEIGMQGIKHEVPTDGDQISRREAFEWYKSTEGPGMAHWYKNSGIWWDKRYGKANDGISVEEQIKNPNSLWNFYKTLISLRKQYPALTYGEVRILPNDNPGVITFVRTLGEHKNWIWVAVNLTGTPQELEKPQYTVNGFQGEVLCAEPTTSRMESIRLSLPRYGIIVSR